MAIKRRPKSTRQQEREEKMKRFKGKSGTGMRRTDIMKRQRDTDTALRLVHDIKDGLVDPRGLSQKQRRACLVFFADGSKTSTQLGVMFKVSAATIRTDLKAMRAEIGVEYSEWGVAEVIGDLGIAAESFVSKALKQGDVGLAWSIKKDFAKTLKDLGLIGPQGDKDGLKITIETMGENYARATSKLARALNPALTGEVIEVEPAKPRKTKVPPLAIPTGPASPVDQDPNIHIER